MLLICTLSLSKCFQSKICYSLRVIVSYLHWIVNFLSFQSLLSLLPKDQISEIVLPSNPVSILLTPERFLARFMQLVRLKKQQFDLGWNPDHARIKKPISFSPLFFANPAYSAIRYSFLLFFQKQKFLTSSRKKSENLKKCLKQILQNKKRTFTVCNGPEKLAYSL